MCPFWHPINSWVYLFELLCLPSFYIYAIKMTVQFYSLKIFDSALRVHTGPGKSEKSCNFWNFPELSSSGKRIQVLESPWNLFNLSNRVFRIYVEEMYVDCKKNWFWNLGNERVYGGIWCHGKLVQVLEKSLKKNTNPFYWISQK